MLPFYLFYLEKVHINHPQVFLIHVDNKISQVTLLPIWVVDVTFQTSLFQDIPGISLNRPDLNSCDLVTAAFPVAEII